MKTPVPGRKVRAGYWGGRGISCTNSCRSTSRSGWTFTPTPPPPQNRTLHMKIKERTCRCRLSGSAQVQAVGGRGAPPPSRLTCVSSRDLHQVWVAPAPLVSYFFPKLSYHFNLICFSGIRQIPFFLAQSTESTKVTDGKPCPPREARLWCGAISTQ